MGGGLPLRRAAAGGDPPAAVVDRTPPAGAPRPGSTGAEGLPEIVLLPGVYEHWTFLRPLGDALSAAGHRVSVVHGLGINRRGVAETSERLGRTLAGRPPPAAGRVIVAHSKGGLIGKHLLVTSGAAAAAVIEAMSGGDAGDAAATAPAPDAATDRRLAARPARARRDLHAVSRDRAAHGSCSSIPASARSCPTTRPS